MFKSKRSIFFGLFLAVIHFDAFTLDGIELYTNAGFKEAVSHTASNDIKTGEVFAKIDEIASFVTESPRNKADVLECTSGIISEITLKTVCNIEVALLLTLKEGRNVFSSIGDPATIESSNLQEGSKVWIVWRFQEDTDGNFTDMKQEVISMVESIDKTHKTLDGEPLSNEEYAMAMDLYEYFLNFTPIDNNLYPCIWYIFSDRNEAINWLKDNPAKQELATD
jgi:hypothetical protein